MGVLFSAPPSIPAVGKHITKPKQAPQKWGHILVLVFGAGVWLVLCIFLFSRRVFGGQAGPFLTPLVPDFRYRGIDVLATTP